MIDEIARAGFKVMIFSGGEPLMRPDIYELGGACGRKRPASRVRLATARSSRPRWRVRLKEAGACAMGISRGQPRCGQARQVPRPAERPRPDHGRHRGVQAARACRSSCTPPWWTGTATRSAPSPTLRWKLAPSTHYVFFLIPVGRGKFIQETSLQVLENERLLCDIMTKASQAPIDVKPTCAPQFTRVAKQLGVETRFTRGCLAGLTYCVVGSEGIVRPCAYMTEEAGDVREQPFDEIWSDEPRVRETAHAGLLRLVRHLRLSRRHAAAAGPAPPTTTTATSSRQDDYCAHGLRRSDEQRS